MSEENSGVKVINLVTVIFFSLRRLQTANITAPSICAAIWVCFLFLHVLVSISSLGSCKRLGVTVGQTLALPGYKPSQVTAAVSQLINGRMRTNPDLLIFSLIFKTIHRN